MIRDRLRLGHRLAATCALVLLTVCAGSAVEPDGVTLAYKHQPGDEARYEMILAGRAQSRVEGDSETTRLEVTVKIESIVTFPETERDAAQKVRGEIVGGEATARSGEEEESQPLEGCVLDYLLTPKGEIKGFEYVSGEPIVLEFAGGALVPGPEDAFLLGGAAVLPQQPVKPGDSWEGIASIPNPAGGDPFELSYRSTYLGTEEHRGMRCHKIKTVRGFSGDDTYTDPGGLGEVRTSTHMWGEHVWFLDQQSWLIVSTDGSDRVVSVTTIDFEDGEPVTLRQAGIVNVRSVLTEFNGAKIESR